MTMTAYLTIYVHSGYIYMVNSFFMNSLVIFKHLKEIIMTREYTIKFPAEYPFVTSGIGDYYQTFLFI